MSEWLFVNRRDLGNQISYLICGEIADNFVAVAVDEIVVNPEVKDIEKPLPPFA